MSNTKKIEKEMSKKKHRKTRYRMIKTSNDTHTEKKNVKNVNK